MRLQASNVRSWLVVLAFIAATTAAAQTSSLAASSLFRGVEGNREQSMAVGIGNPAATGSAEASLPDAPSAVAAAQTAQNAPVPANQAVRESPKALTNASPGPLFITANGMLLGSTLANAEFMTRCRPSACQSVPDDIRTRGALYAIGIPASAGISYISYRIKRGGSRWWIMPVAAFMAGNIVYSVHASQWSR